MICPYTNNECEELCIGIPSCMGYDEEPILIKGIEYDTVIPRAKNSITEHQMDMPITPEESC